MLYIEDNPIDLVYKVRCEFKQSTGSALRDNVATCSVKRRSQPRKVSSWADRNLHAAKVYPNIIRFKSGYINAWWQPVFSQKIDNAIGNNEIVFENHGASIPAVDKFLPTDPVTRKTSISAGSKPVPAKTDRKRSYLFGNTGVSPVDGGNSFDFNPKTREFRPHIFSTVEPIVKIDAVGLHGVTFPIIRNASIPSSPVERFPNF
jgi:hypothetical protein